MRVQETYLTKGGWPAVAKTKDIGETRMACLHTMPDGEKRLVMHDIQTGAVADEYQDSQMDLVL